MMRFMTSVRIISVDSRTVYIYIYIYPKYSVPAAGRSLFSVDDGSLEVDVDVLFAPSVGWGIGSSGTSSCDVGEARLLSSFCWIPLARSSQVFRCSSLMGGTLEAMMQ